MLKVFPFLFCKLLLGVFCVLFWLWIELNYHFLYNYFPNGLNLICFEVAEFKRRWFGVFDKYTAVVDVRFFFIGTSSKRFHWFEVVFVNEVQTDELLLHCTRYNTDILWCSLNSLDAWFLVLYTVETFSNEKGSFYTTCYLKSFLWRRS